MIEEQHAVEMVDLVLDGARLVPGDGDAIRAAVAVERLELDLARTLHVAEDLGNGEAAFLRGFRLGARGQDARVDEHERRRRLLAHVHHGDAPRDPDLVRRETHPLGRAHRLEQVVHEAPDVVVDRGDRGGLLAQHRRTEHVELQHAHGAGFASTGASRPTMLVMPLRTTTSFDSPLRTVTWSSLMRSEEHTSELQSLAYLVCRLLLEKK